VSESNAQRRKFPRIASQNVILVRGDESASAEGLARTKALGLGGCCFVSAAPPAVGSTVELLLSLGGRVIKTRSRIVYANPVNDKAEIGAEFVEIAAEDRDYLKEYFDRQAAGE
jgi:hypothetical protein